MPLATRGEADRRTKGATDRACYHAPVMHALVGLLALVVLATSTDDVHPIEVKPEHGAIVWSVMLDAGASSCRARAWIGRMGEQPLSTLFAVDLDEEVAHAAEGETPLLGLEPGTYDLHFEGDGCWWHYSLVGR